MAQKIVVLKLAVMAPYQSDLAVPLKVAELLKVRDALPEGYDLQQFEIGVYEHAEKDPLPGETIPSKRDMN